VREQRLVFGEDAELYDRVRSAYPEALVDRLVALVPAPKRAVDAGCGTGKLTVQLAERGVTGVGVEPHPAMAAVAARNLAPYPGWRVDVADFERWEPREDELPFDLVACATAWHWIDRDAGAAQAARLVRPGGFLAIVSHRIEQPATPLQRELDAAYARWFPGPSGLERAPVEKVPPGAPFAAPLRRDCPDPREYTTGEWLEHLKTSSDHMVLPEERRRPLLEELAAAIERHGGRFHEHLVRELWAYERL
jgi:SAM-dependent methyltransferase